MSEKAGISLEQRLINNAVDTVVANAHRYDAAALVHLLDRVLDQRPELRSSFASVIGAEILTKGRAGSMAMPGTEEMDYLTLPVMHRNLLRGIQQMQDALMPGGFLLKGKEVSPADSVRMLRDCTTQMEKVLRLTKGVRAMSEINRLKEAIAAGINAVSSKVGPEHRDSVMLAFKEAFREKMTGTGGKLNEAMKDAEEL